MSNPTETSAPAPEKLGQSEMFPVDQIVPDPANRKDHSPAGIKLLAAEIQAVGLIQPIVIRQHPTLPGKYMIVAGERRWLAHRELKRDTIEARLSDPATSEQLSTRRRAAENFHREDLSPIEKAEVLQQLFEQKMTQAEIAAFIGAKDPSSVSNFLRIRKLPEAVKKWVHDGTLSRAHAVTLARFVRWPKACKLIAEETVHRGITSKSLEQDAVPFGWDLERAKLVEKIDTSPPSKYWPGAHYRIPEELKSDPDFIKSEGGSIWFCFAPEKWAPHKAKCEEEFKAAQKKKEKGEATKQSKMSPAEKAARQKVIAENKQARTESALAHECVMQQLRDGKANAAAITAVVVKTALIHRSAHVRLKDVAEQLGIALDNKFAFQQFKTWGKLSSVDALRLTCGILLDIQSKDAIECSREIEEDVAHVLGEKDVARLKKQAAQQIAAAKKGPRV